MKKDRRDFLKIVIAGTTLTVGAAVATKIIPGTSNPKSIKNLKKSEKSQQTLKYKGRGGPDDPNVAFGMIIDLDKCDGCLDKLEEVTVNGKTYKEPPCVKSCRINHNVPIFTPTTDYPEKAFDSNDDTMYWIKIFQKKDNPYTEPYFFPRVCMQCEFPPCVDVCPVSAAFRNQGDGLVLVDTDRCIGCRLCIAACPYEARYFNWKEYKEPNKLLAEKDTPFRLTNHVKGTTEKCDFCGHEGYEGRIAHCAAGCPEGAIYYGNLKENVVVNSKGEVLKVDETIKKYSGYRFKEELGTNPRVYYLPKRH